MTMKKLGANLALILAFVVVLLPQPATAQDGHGLRLTSCYSVTGRCIPQSPSQPAAIGSTLIIELNDNLSDSNDTLSFPITGNPTLTGRLPNGIHRKYCVNANGERSYSNTFVVSTVWPSPLDTECAVPYPEEVSPAGQSGPQLFLPFIGV